MALHSSSPGIPRPKLHVSPHCPAARTPHNSEVTCHQGFHALLDRQSPTPSLYDNRDDKNFPTSNNFESPHFLHASKAFQIKQLGLEVPTIPGWCSKWQSYMSGSKYCITFEFPALPPLPKSYSLASEGFANLGDFRCFSHGKRWVPWVLPAAFPWGGPEMETHRHCLLPVVRAVSLLQNLTFMCNTSLLTNINFP